MAKRLTERQLLALKLDALNDSEVREVLEDDWVASLANAHENKRARQAFEWEAVRRRAERRAAANWTRL